MNLIENIVRQTLLIEGRLEDTKKKYPQVNPKVIDRFYVATPGNGKYLDWMSKMINNLPPDMLDFDPIKLIDDVTYFHNNQQSFEQKDINQYKRIQELEEAVNEVYNKKQLKQERKNVDKIYEDSDWLVISPKSHSASCAYGAGTKWCITAKDSDHHWKRETSNAIMYFIIDKNKTKDDNLYKVALQYFASDKKIFWDAEDTQVTFSLPKNIEELINKHKEENLE
jgi:hypothetical protein